MAVKVGINGFGRIGRQVLKAIRDMYPNELEVEALNDIVELKTMWHLLKYDSTYGRFNGAVEYTEDGLLIDGKKVKVFKETDPAAIPWKDLGVEIVIESTGLFTIKDDGVNKKGKNVKGAVNHIRWRKESHHFGSCRRRRPHRCVGRQRRQVRPEDSPRCFKRFLHHKLFSPGRESCA